MMYEWHSFGGGFMWIFWILLIAVIWWAVRFASGREGGSTEKQKSALEILDERYAKGEIEREEYEQKRNDLRG
jgi:putative membrane protein